MKWLSHRFWLWVGHKIEDHYAQDNTDRDLQGLTADHMWEIPIDDDIKSSEPMTFNSQVTMDDHLQNINKEVVIALQSSEVLKDRVLSHPEKWDEPVIKKGYDKPN